MNKYGTILVVDDNTSILTAMRYLLGNIFERVLTTTQPDEVLKLMAQETIDIVLLDMNFTLGVNNGSEGLFWLRTIRKQHPQIPIVLMTAYADINLAVKGLKCGAADFVTKPWDNDELVRKLKDVLDMKNEIVSPEDNRPLPWQSHSSGRTSWHYATDTLQQTETTIKFIVHSYDRGCNYNRYHCFAVGSRCYCTSSTETCSACPSDGGGYTQP